MCLMQRVCFAVIRFVLVYLVFSLPLMGEEPAAPGAEHPGRPRVGLVLGGGGALGISHIGVIKVLEEMRIPVDYIGGTSMGSIIAGLYAAGMSPEEMERVFLELDWWDILKDQTPYRDLDFRRKYEASRYLMDLELGLRGYRLLFPHGFASGQKFNNLMRAMTVNASGISDFDDLNIPFRAVATDLRSGEPVILRQGSLPMAMRASMAVPGAFTPVEINGQLLVDGGLVNNIPVDVVKAMGADIIIAVDVGSSSEQLGRKATFDSLGQILGRTYAIMQRPKDNERRAAADILIEPDLNGLSASDFARAADLIPPGASAARGMEARLAGLSLPEEDYAAWRAGQRKAHADTMRISSVKVTGNKMVPAGAIEKRMKVKPGDPVDFDAIDHDIARIYGMGDFQTVSHRLKPAAHPGDYDLEIETSEKYWGPTFVHFGLRLESDFEGETDWGMLFNIRRSNLNRLGGEWSTDLELGSRQRILTEWYQPLQQQSFFFIAPGAVFESEVENVYMDGEKVAEYDRDIYAGRFDLGTQFKQYGEVRAGLMAGHLKASPDVGSTDLPSVDQPVRAATASFTLDRLDDRIFPEQGIYLKLNGFFSSEALGAEEDYDKLDARARWFGTSGRHTFGIDLNAGSSTDDALPTYDLFSLGGMGTFAGLSPDELRGSHYGVARLNYRYRLGRLSPSLGRNVYLIGSYNAGNAWMDREDIDEDDLIHGGLLGVALDTNFGPVGVAGSLAEEGRRVMYLTVGTVF